MNIYDFKINDWQGNEIDFAQFKNKVLLIVNTATKCGFTPQYDELDKLYAKYKEQGLEILDFPCNQFFKQAPGTDSEYHGACRRDILPPLTEVGASCSRILLNPVSAS